MADFEAANVDRFVPTQGGGSDRPNVATADAKEGMLVYCRTSSGNGTLWLCTRADIGSGLELVWARILPSPSGWWTDAFSI